jgi:aryl carrier-like protein
MKADYSDTLRRLWLEVLRLEIVADDDDFFAVGGDSIKALSLSRRIEQETGQRLRFIDVLRHSTISRQNKLLLSPTIRSGLKVTPAPETYDTVSAIQRDFFLLDQMTRREDLAHTTTVRLVDVEITREQGAAAFADTLRRHEILRTTFRLHGGVVRAEVRAADCVAGFEFCDFDGRTLQALYEGELGRPLDVRNGPVVRLLATPIGPGRCALLLSIHHIAADGFSSDIVIEDFLSFLRKDGRCQPLVSAYRDYAFSLAVWLSGDDGRRSREFWRARLTGFRKPASFAGQAASARHSFAGSRETLTIGSELHENLRRLCVAMDTTLFVVLHSCVKTFLYLETGSEDLVTGSAVSTRDSAELSGQIGPFMNTLPFRMRIASDRSFRSIVAEVKEATLAAFENKLVPLAVIMADLDRQEPLFDVGFTLQNHVADFDSSPLMPHRPPRHSELISTLLWFVAWQRDSGLEIDLHYRRAAFTVASVQAMAERLSAALQSFVAAPDASLSQLFADTAYGKLASIDFDFGDMGEARV